MATPSPRINGASGAHPISLCHVGAQSLQRLIRGSDAGLEVLKEDGEVIVMLHNLFAVEEMVLKRAQLLCKGWHRNS